MRYLNGFMGGLLVGLVLPTVLTVAAESVTFPDVPSDAWYGNALTNVSQLGIFQGNDSGEFMPDRSVNRAELAVVVDRLLRHLSGEKIPAASMSSAVSASVRSSLSTHSLSTSAAANNSVQSTPSSALASISLQGCRPLDLTVKTEASVRDGRVTGDLIFKNQQTGGSCKISGVPTVTLTGSRGVPLPVEMHSNGNATVLQLYSGSEGRVHFSWENWCDDISTDHLVLLLQFSGQSEFLTVPLTDKNGSQMGAAPTCTDASRPSVLSVDPFRS